jgi:hypothetical protein
MKNRSVFLTAYRLIFGLLGFSALVTEIAVLVQRGTFDVTNFLSYFTVENNILVILALLLGAVGLRLDRFRSATTIYILIVGLGFSIFLSGLDGVEFTAIPWDNAVLHYIMPIVMTLDLLLDRPRRKTTFKQALAWLLFPIVYVVYSLVRGNLTGWYPYPFLNPANGMTALLLTVGGIVVLAVVLTWIVSRLSGAKRHAA